MRRAFKCLLVCHWSRGFILLFRVSNLSSFRSCSLLSWTRHDARATPFKHTYLHAPSAPSSRDAARACLWCKPTQKVPEEAPLVSCERGRDPQVNCCCCYCCARARSFTCKQRHKEEEWWKRQRGCGVDGKQRPDGTSQRVISPFGASLQLLWWCLFTVVAFSVGFCQVYDIDVQFPKHVLWHFAVFLPQMSLRSVAGVCL